MEESILNLGTKTACYLLLITHNGADMSQFWNDVLRDSGFCVGHASFSNWHNVIIPEPPQIILLDATEDLPNALHLCQEAAENYPNIPLVSIMRRSDLSEHGLVWRSNGAAGFLRIDAARVEIESTLENTVRTAKIEETLSRLKRQLTDSHQYHGTAQLLNRRRFFHDAHRECSRARRYGRPLSCIMVGINHYDDYRRIYGEACADCLIWQLSPILRQQTRESDVVARFAPNKIVALLPETDISGAVIVRERIITAIENHRFLWEKKPLPFSVSIGEAERPRSFDAPLPDDEEDAVISVREEIAQLLEDADNALMVAQKSVRRPEIFISYAEVPMPVNE